MKGASYRCMMWLALAVVSATVLVWSLGLAIRPDVTLQVSLHSQERFKTRILINEELPSKSKVRLEQRIAGAAYERTLHIPVRAPLVESVRVEVGPVVSDQTVSAAISHVRLLSASGDVLRDEPVTGMRWESGAPLGLKRMPWWVFSLGHVLAGLGLIAALMWFVRLARQIMPSASLYLAWLVVGLMLSSLVYASLLAWQRGPWMSSERWVNDFTFHKLHLAANHAPPRLLTVGGSSGLYGLSAEELTKQMGRKTLNLNLHAGLPLSYHLSLAEEVARDGDDFLLQLEFSYLEAAPRLDQWRVEQLNVWAWQGLPAEWFGVRFPELVVNTPLDWVAAGALAKLFVAAKTESFPLEARLPDGRSFWLYGDPYLGLNAHGDLLTSEPPAGSAKPAPHRYLRDATFDPTLPALQALADFVNRAQFARRRVYLVFPPTIASPLADFTIPSRVKWTDAFTAWSAQHGLQVLGRPEMMQQPLERFLDTMYHLTPSGRREHTMRVARLLSDADWPQR